MVKETWGVGIFVVCELNLDSHCEFVILLCVLVDINCGDIASCGRDWGILEDAGGPMACRIMRVKHRYLASAAMD